MGRSFGVNGLGISTTSRSRSRSGRTRTEGRREETLSSMDRIWKSTTPVRRVPQGVGKSRGHLVVRELSDTRLAGKGRSELRSITAVCRTRKGTEVRRVLLPKTTYHVYYELDPHDEMLMMLVVWGARRYGAKRRSDPRVTFVPRIQFARTSMGAPRPSPCLLVMGRRRDAR